jgi:hypothetical protein
MTQTKTTLAATHLFISGIKGITVSSLFQHSSALLCLFVLFSLISFPLMYRDKGKGRKGQAKQRECWKKRPCTRLTRDFDSRVDGQPSSSFSLNGSLSIKIKREEGRGRLTGRINESLLLGGYVSIILRAGIPQDRVDARIPRSRCRPICLVESSTAQDY